MERLTISAEREPLVTARILHWECSIRFLIVLLIGAMFGGALFGLPAFGDGSISVLLSVERHSALTGDLIKNVKRSVEQSVRETSAANNVEWIKEFDGKPHLRSSEIAALSSDVFRRTWQKDEPLLLLHVDHDVYRYKLTLREYVPRYQTLSPVVELTTVQRAMISNMVTRSFAQAHCPTGRIVAMSDKFAKIRFDNRQTVDVYSSQSAKLPVGVDPVIGFRLFNTEKSQWEDRAFLQCTSWDNQIADCELIASDSVRRLINSRFGSYEVQPAIFRDLSTVVRVVQRGSLDTIEGCEVFCSSDDFSTTESSLIGITSEDGSLMVPFDTTGVQRLVVRYLDLVIRRPYLPAPGQRETVFELPTKGQRASYVQSLKRLHRELMDEVHRDNKIVQELTKSVKAKDTAKIRSLLVEAQRDRMSMEQVEEKVEQVGRDAESAGEDVSSLGNQIIEYARTTATKPLDLGEFAQMSDRLETASRVKELATEIRAAQKDFDWEKLLPLYKELVRLNPDDQNAARQMRALSQSLEVKDSSHSNARDYVQKNMKKMSLSDLEVNWNRIDQTVSKLLEVEDHLWLLRANKELNRWGGQITEAVNELNTDIAELGNDAAEAERLEQRRLILKKVYDPWVEMEQKVRTFLQNMNF